MKPGKQDGFRFALTAPRYFRWRKRARLFALQSFFLDFTDEIGDNLETRQVLRKAF